MKEYSFKGSWNDFFEILYKPNRIVNGSWFDYNLGWWEHRDDPKFFFVTFEEMKRDIHGVMDKLCKFLDKKLSPELVEEIVQHTSFNKMKDNKMVNYSFFGENIDQKISPFMRKGQVGDWRNWFTPEQDEYCDMQLKEKLTGIGLTFE